MADDVTQARLQRIEDHLRSLDARVSVLSAVDSGAAKKRIAETFSDPRTVIIYRGVQAGLTQGQIADALKERDLPRPQQQRVSDTIDELAELGFVARTRKKGRFVVVDGWDAFGLDHVLKKTLRTNKVDNLG